MRPAIGLIPDITIILEAWGDTFPVDKIDHERNRLEAALVQNTKVLNLIRADNKPDGRICVMVFQNSILWQMGRYEEAGKAMDDRDAFFNESAQYFLPNLTAYRTKWKLLDGDKATFLHS